LLISLSIMFCLSPWSPERKEGWRYKSFRSTWYRTPTAWSRIWTDSKRSSRGTETRNHRSLLSSPTSVMNKSCQ
jgi:hypothetical protein